MKQTLAAAIVIALAAVPAAAQPHAGQLGAGVEVGEEDGVTGQYWLGPSQAFDAGLGDSAGEVSFHAGYTWHAWDILPKPPKGTFGLYGGLGFRLREDQFGLRPVGGLEYWLPAHPVQAFVEAGPIFRLTPDAGVDGTGVVGLRFFFDTHRG